MPCFSICSLTHPFTCLLPVPLCSKATGAPLCFGTRASPAPKRLALLAIATRATQQPSPTTLLVLLPHHRAALPSCLFLGFSFYNLPPARVGGGGSSSPSFLFLCLFLVGKPNTCLRAEFAGGKLQCSFTIWTFGWALIFPDFWRWSILQWWHFIANRH